MSLGGAISTTAAGGAIVSPGGLRGAGAGKDAVGGLPSMGASRAVVVRAWGVVPVSLVAILARSVCGMS